MKNKEVIINKKSSQIKELLNKMNCYTYSDEGIDKWLSIWLKNKRAMIENIAEKSPYYDGDCKIVFPAEYPRKINSLDINDFANWLLPEYHLKEVIINGMTYKEARSISDALYYVNAYSMNNETLIRLFEANGDKKIFDDYKEALKKIESEHISDTIYEFESSCDYYELYGRMYVRSEVNMLYDLRNFLTTKSNHVQYITNKMATTLSNICPDKRFGEGEKLSRAVKKILIYLGINKHEEFEKRYAKFADALNPINIERWTVISWDPIDYLTMSFGDHWSSCFTIDRNNVRNEGELTNSHSEVTNYVNDDYHFSGSSCANVVKYMLDSSTFVFYTVNKKYEEKDYELQNKVTRCLFSISDDFCTLIQSRAYPQCLDTDEVAYSTIREIVQKVISEALDSPNLWTKKSRDSIYDYALLEGNIFADFNDSRNRLCNLSYRGDTPKKIFIGSYPMCPNCGREFYYDEDYDEDNDGDWHLNCNDCR